MSYVVAAGACLCLLVDSKADKRRRHDQHAVCCACFALLSTDLRDPSMKVMRPATPPIVGDVRLQKRMRDKTTA